MRVAIVGGGIMGISLGYFLSKRGASVEIFEASGQLGGLAGPIVLEDGTAVDRFYHAILPSDRHLRQLCAELGIADKLRFKQTRTGFYYQGAIHPMDGLQDFMKFPPLGWWDRFRLALTVLRAQLIRNWQRLERISAEAWLRRWSGPRTYENIWRPLLNAKFDGGFDEIPATYIWSRLVRMKSTRQGARQKESAGHLQGGYITLLRAMVDQIEGRGGKVHLQRPIQEIMIERGSAWGLRYGNQASDFDAIVATVQAPIFKHMIPDAKRDYLESLERTEYLGIIAPLMVLDSPLTGYWTLNIADEGYPFTGIIETTTYIEPQLVGGNHLVYLPKYTNPGSPWQEKPEEQIRETWLEKLETMFPDFRRGSVREFLVHRERFVEPLRKVGMANTVPEVDTPIDNLFLATTAQIYPALTNGESVSRHARRSAQLILREQRATNSWLVGAPRELMPEKQALN